MPLSHYSGKNVWILKPTSLNRGKGIHVVSSLKKAKKLIRDYCRGKEDGDHAPTTTDNKEKTKPSNVLKHNTFILQKYIEDPMLIKKRKFDIRVWMLITQEQEVFFFKEGYLRLSSREYSVEKRALDDDFVHLTNNAVQKHAPGYGALEEGN